MDPMRSRNATTRSPQTSGHLLTLAQVVDLLSLRPREVVEYVRRGELSGERVGRSWQFTRAAVDDFLEEPPAWRPADVLGHGE